MRSRTTSASSIQRIFECSHERGIPKLAIYIIRKGQTCYALSAELRVDSKGKRPFGGEGKTLATVFNEIIQITPLDPDSVSEQLPHELSALIMKTLQKDPANRFQSGKELADALNVCLGVGQRADIATTTPVPPVQSRKTVYIVYVIPLASAAVLSIVAGWLFFFSHHKEPSPLKNTFPTSESREVSPPGTRRTDLMNADKKRVPSVFQPAPTIKKAEIPDRGTSKEMSKQAPSPVPTGSSTKQAVKPDTKQVKETKPPLPPIAAQEKPAAKKAESSGAGLPGDRNAERPKPVASLPQQQNGGAQIPLPIKSEPLPKFAFLKVRTTPKGATVYVDGIQKGTSPLTLKLSLGKYRVKLGLAGYLDTERMVSLDRMTEYPLTETLRPIARNKTGNRP